MTDLVKLEEHANHLVSREDYPAARLAFEEALRVAESSLTAEPRVIGRLLNNAGFSCRGAGDLRAAEDYFRRALQVYEEMENPEDPEIAVTLQHLGRKAHLRRDYESSWQYWTEALEIWKRFIFADEANAGYIPYLASCLHACGEHLADTGDHQAARRNFEQALHLRRLNLPADHPDITESLMHLGKLCAFLGDYPAALPYLQEAVPLLTKALGPDHKVVQDVKRTLATAEEQALDES
jgi:tetratricopeptide (TPR) repeat protein